MQRPRAVPLPPTGASFLSLIGRGGGLVGSKGRGIAPLRLPSGLGCSSAQNQHLRTAHCPNTAGGVDSAGPVPMGAPWRCRHMIISASRGLRSPTPPRHTTNTYLTKPITLPVQRTFSAPDCSGPPPPAESRYILGGAVWLLTLLGETTPPGHPRTL